MEALCVHGRFGELLTVDEENLLITIRKAKTLHPIRNIKSIALTKPTSQQAGEIYIELGGLAPLSTVRFIYVDRDVQAAEKIVGYVQSYDSRMEAPAATPLDEIKKLKDLLDSGAITQEEYALIKGKIIASM